MCSKHTPMLVHPIMGPHFENLLSRPQTPGAGIDKRATNTSQGKGDVRAKQGFRVEWTRNDGSDSRAQLPLRLGSKWACS